MSHNDYMYAINRSDEYLAHYGVPNMKWGVRKSPPELMRPKKSNALAYSRQYQKAAQKLAVLSSNGGLQARSGQRTSESIRSAKSAYQRNLPQINRLRNEDEDEDELDDTNDKSKNRSNAFAVKQLPKTWKVHRRR